MDRILQSTVHSQQTFPPRPSVIVEQENWLNSRLQGHRVRKPREIVSYTLPVVSVWSVEPHFLVSGFVAGNGICHHAYTASARVSIHHSVAKVRLCLDWSSNSSITETGLGSIVVWSRVNNICSLFVSDHSLLGCRHCHKQSFR